MNRFYVVPIGQIQTFSRCPIENYYRLKYAFSIVIFPAGFLPPLQKGNFHLLIFDCRKDQLVKNSLKKYSSELCSPSGML
jgi:hypothetical protein